ncbi:hypothetical protein [Luteimonas sp. R10]|uniref:hypothetical protein n=1 Tax=Luteimonas sp. R10 TaxID=3108176 RepID=UPI003093D210|nr:hypothetical protein U3649_14440 [Luteimonas sp. R10]
MSDVTKLPVDHFNKEMRRLGREIPDDATQAWRNGEWGLRMTWPDGFSTWVSFGPEATAIVELYLGETRH